MNKSELIVSLLAALMRHEIYPAISDEELTKMTMGNIIDFMVSEAVNTTRTCYGRKVNDNELARKEPEHE